MEKTLENAELQLDPNVIVPEVAEQYLKDLSYSYLSIFYQSFLDPKIISEKQQVLVEMGMPVDRIATQAELFDYIKRTSETTTNLSDEQIKESYTRLYFDIEAKKGAVLGAKKLLGQSAELYLAMKNKLLPFLLKK